MSSDGWNLLVYAIDDNTSEPQSVVQMIGDLRQALTSDRCNIAVQVMARSRTTRYWISADATEEQVLRDVVDASRAEALASFLDDARARLPAASTALVLRAHATGLDNVHDYPEMKGGGLGGGTELGRRPGGASFDREAVLNQMALLGGPGRIEEPERPESYGCRWGPDPNSHRYLTNVAMKKAILASKGERVDLLGLNSCWMATLEIAYELRSVAGVVVASQVYAKPWPYRAIAEALSSDPAQPAEELARRIVAGVRSEIARGAREDAVSAFRAGPAMKELADAFEVYARRVTALLGTDWDAVCDAVMSRAQRIDDPHQVDLVSLTKVLGDDDPEAKAAGRAVRDRFQAMRLAHVAHPAHPGVSGMSIFCPKSIRVDLADAYRGTEFQGMRWATFLREFQRRLVETFAALGGPLGYAPEPAGPDCPSCGRNVRDPAGNRTAAATGPTVVPPATLDDD